MAEFCRAIVMLAVLVGLPAVWIYYGPLPESAQQVVDRLVALAREASGMQQSEVAVTPAKVPAIKAVQSFSSPERRTEPSAAPITATGPPASLETQLEPLLRRLRSLGTTEYTLEPWGFGGQFFRFRCEVPVADDQKMTRQFEAVSESPQASVQQVLGEVKQWQVAMGNHPQIF